MNRSIPPHYRVQFVSLLVTFLTWSLGIIPFKLYRFVVRSGGNIRGGTGGGGGTSYQSISNEAGAGLEGSTQSSTLASGDASLLDAKGNEAERRLLLGYLTFFSAVLFNYLFTIHNVVIDTLSLIIMTLQFLVLVSYWGAAQQFGDLFFHLENVITLVLIITAFFGQGDVVY